MPPTDPYKKDRSLGKGKSKGKGVVKHVSRACLACRSRHLKCDGNEPICARCVKAHRVCQYVKSNRGGSRRKGVSMKKKFKSQSLRMPRKRSHIEPDDFVLPCVKNGRPDLENQPGCRHQCMDMNSYNELPPCLRGEIPAKYSDPKNKKIDMYPVFNASHAQNSLEKVFDPKKLAPTLDQCYISPALTRNLNVESVVNTYYKYFHGIHPFLPSRDEIMTYLNAIPYNYDLVLAMKLIGDGQSSDIYSRDVETVQFLITSITDFIKQIGKDIVSLQSLLLLAMAAHISSLHDLSMTLREALVSLALELKLNYLDLYSVPPTFMDVNGFITESGNESNKTNSVNNFKNGVHLMNTPTDSDGKDDVLTELQQSRRTANIPKHILENTVRRTIWEVYFFDTVSGTASGHTMSLLASRKMLVLYPKSIPPSVFDYRSRAEACKLVNDSIQLNVSIQANKEVQSHLTHMKAAIGNWEMKLENPDMYNSPYLVNADGHVNEGMFEAEMLVNYAQIFTHRPFSYLWRPDISKHPRCSDEEGVTDNCPALKKQEVDSRKIIETRKTIDSASSLVKSLLDTNPAKITSRTPFLACALAFSCLVHLSAFSWVDSSLRSLGDTSASSATLKNNINEEELDTYTEYIKLELGAILQISRHWGLSAKLAQHIRETIKRVSPKLYAKIRAGMPEAQQGVQLESGDSLRMDTSKASVSTSLSYQTPSLSTTSSTQAISSIKTPTDDMLQNMLSRPNDDVNNWTQMGPNAASTTGKTSKNISLGQPSIQKSNSVNAPALSINEMNETDFNNIVDDNYLSLSPTSDTGCHWVDKHVFEFDNYGNIPTNEL